MPAGQKTAPGGVFLSGGMELAENSRFFRDRRLKKIKGTVHYLKQNIFKHHKGRGYETECRCVGRW